MKERQIENLAKVADSLSMGFPDDNVTRSLKNTISQGGIPSGNDIRASLTDHGGWVLGENHPYSHKVGKYCWVARYEGSTRDWLLRTVPGRWIITIERTGSLTSSDSFWWKPLGIQTPRPPEEE